MLGRVKRNVVLPPPMAAIGGIAEARLLRPPVAAVPKIEARRVQYGGVAGGGAESTGKIGRNGIHLEIGRWSDAEFHGVVSVDFQELHFEKDFAVRLLQILDDCAGEPHTWDGVANRYGVGIEGLLNPRCAGEIANGANDV